MLKKPSRMPEHFPCILCEVDVTDEDRAIECDKCKKWIHHGCAGWNDEQYEQAVEMDTLEFCCHKCKKLERQCEQAAIQKLQPTSASVSGARQEMESVADKEKRLAKWEKQLSQ